jgi:carbonic anhydrase
VKRLLDGVIRYEYETRAQLAPQFAALASGQTPGTMFVTCADSRVVPSIIASAGPGELFVVRNIANLIPKHGDPIDASVGAAIAYAVDVLGVEDIVVCGHSGCGGMKALLGSAPLDASIDRWLAQARPFVEAWRSLPSDKQDLAEHDRFSRACTLQQLDHLATHPSVRNRVIDGSLRLHAWWFDISSARLLAYSRKLREYVAAIDEVSRLAVA